MGWKIHKFVAGAVPAIETYLMSLLQSKPSKALVLLAGGSRETSLQKSGHTYTIISNRKGFVRTALKTGLVLLNSHGIFFNPKWSKKVVYQPVTFRTALVPCFSFGENRIFDCHTIDWPWLTKITDVFHRITGLKILLPKGRGLFQNKFGLLPRQSPINTIGMYHWLKFSQSKIKYRSDIFILVVFWSQIHNISCFRFPFLFFAIAIFPWKFIFVSPKNCSSKKCGKIEIIPSKKQGETRK